MFVKSSKMAESDLKKIIKLVPENLLKRRKAYQAIKATEAKLALQQKRKIQRGRPVKFKRLEEFLHESKQKRRDDIRLKLASRMRPPALPPAKNRLAFVVRIKQIKGVSLEVRKVIQMFRLRKIFSGTFVKISRTSLIMLKAVEPYVAWGFPNLKSVRELILKRGKTRINNKETPLTDNAIIEEHLGKYGIICLEDLIHEIFSTGMNFRVVNNYLLPFPLSVARHAARDKAGLMRDIGNSGARGEDINKIIRLLN